MELSKKEIQHIAELARLDLSGKELDIYGSQLSDILSFVKQLQEVDTTAIEPTAQVTGLENVFREDEIAECGVKEKKDSLNQAPALENNQVKVKRIL